MIDRIKESFKYKNYPIFPSHIENVIEEIKGVELVCVVGIYDQKIGTDFATAAVKLSPNAQEVTKEKIIDYVAEKLPEIYHLRGGVYFVDFMTMTPNGKVQRRKVKEMILNLRK